jgi:hypothetical protein
VLRVALNLSSAAVVDGDQDAAGIRAVMRADSVDDALHLTIIRSMVETGLALAHPASKGWPGCKTPYTSG